MLVAVVLQSYWPLFLAGCIVFLFFLAGGGGGGGGGLVKGLF